MLCLYVRSRSNKPFGPSPCLVRILTVTSACDVGGSIHVGACGGRVFVYGGRVYASGVRGHTTKFSSKVGRKGYTLPVHWTMEAAPPAVVNASSGACDGAGSPAAKDAGICSGVKRARTADGKSSPTTRTPTLRVEPLNDAAREFYKSAGQQFAGDAGVDLYIIEEQTVKAGETALLRLGFRAEAVDCEGRPASWLLMPRSSISKTPLRLANSVGLIDAGYRGEVMCAVDNIKTADYTVRRGDRLVQAVFFDGRPFRLCVAEKPLTETARGEGGFGSTGGAAAEPAAAAAPEEATTTASAANTASPASE